MCRARRGCLVYCYHDRDLLSIKQTDLIQALIETEDCLFSVPPVLVSHASLYYVAVKALPHFRAAVHLTTIVLVLALTTLPVPPISFVSPLFECHLMILGTPFYSKNSILSHMFDIFRAQYGRLLQ